MQSLRAHVHNGRLVLDEPTDLPEGAEVELIPADSDELDEGDRARLHAALDAADDEVQAGHTIDGADVIARLRRTPR
jgi:hypothetical protein